MRVKVLKTTVNCLPPHKAIQIASGISTRSKNPWERGVINILEIAKQPIDLFGGS
jgi:hypothetical protein